MFFMLSLMHNASSRLVNYYFMRVSNTERTFYNQSTLICLYESLLNEQKAVSTLHDDAKYLLDFQEQGEVLTVGK